MENKENVIIYPYDSNFAPILRSKNFTDSYNVLGLSSLNGWGLCGKDASFADGGNDLNIKVENKFEEYFDICDTVIFTKSDYNIDYERFVYPKIFSAINAGKNIISLINLYERQNEIEKCCTKKKVTFKSFFQNYSDKNLYFDRLIEEGILDINTPIISVIGISENTHKFSSQVQLKHNLENMGYNVVVIGSRDYCDFLGFNSFPNFMSDDNISEAEKIYYFNRYVKSIELAKKPDVIIISVPGGIIPYNNHVTNNFGITAFEVFQAVTPDAAVLCIFYELYTSEYFKLLFNHIKYKFGFEIDAFNITNRRIDWIEMNNGHHDKIKHVTLRLDNIKKAIDNCRILTNVPIYNTLNEVEQYNMAQMLVDKLVESESATII